jgi:uncharacterized protein YigA (DUF484 family)
MATRTARAVLRRLTARHATSVHDGAEPLDRVVARRFDLEAAVLLDRVLQRAQRDSEVVAEEAQRFRFRRAALARLRRPTATAVPTGPLS